ncbi:MAG: hypothetical protein V3T30_07990, partial [Thermodesulfobacteriota bacterium]
GKEIMEDIQRILDDAREVSEKIINNNKDVLESLVDLFVSEVIVNTDGIVKFFKDHPLST